MNDIFTPSDVRSELFFDWEISEEDFRFLDTIEKPTTQTRNVFSKEELDYIRQALAQNEKYTEDSDSGVRSNRVIKYLKGNEEIFDFVRSRVPSLQDPNVGIRYALFSMVHYGFLVHGDVGKANEVPGGLPYQNILIPLNIDNYENIETEKNKLFVFDQKSKANIAAVIDSGESILKMIKKNGRTEEEIHSALAYIPLVTKEMYHRFVYGLTGVDCADEELLALCSHRGKNDFYGMSVKDTVTWELGSVIEFDSRRVHCSSDFNKLGAKSKELLVIMTYIKK